MSGRQDGVMPGMPGCLPANDGNPPIGDRATALTAKAPERRRPASGWARLLYSAPSTPHSNRIFARSVIAWARWPCPASIAP